MLLPVIASSSFSLLLRTTRWSSYPGASAPFDTTCVDATSPPRGGSLRGLELRVKLAGPYDSLHCSADHCPLLSFA